MSTRDQLHERKASEINAKTRKTLEAGTDEEFYNHSCHEFGRLFGKTEMRLIALDLAKTMRGVSEHL